MRDVKKLLVVFLTIFLLAAVAGCQRGNEVEKVSPGKNTVPEKEATEEVAVYYLKDYTDDIHLVREVHRVSSKKDIKVAALEELITGTPKTKGAYKVLPESTKVRGIKVKDGLATVDFSRDVLQANVGSRGEHLGILSIVNTLAEFPDVEQVSFTVEGQLDERTRDWWGHIGLYDQPFKPNLSEVWEPAIWVNSPKPGAKVTSPLAVTGSAQVFEATVSLRLVTKDGKKLAEDFTTASAGAPERGVFKTVLEFEPPAAEDGYLDVFWNSPKDGSELDKVRVPVEFVSASRSSRS